MHEPDDIAVVEELRKDPETGSVLLEKEYKGALFALARRFVADRFSAEALVYQTFADAVARIGEYDAAKGDFKGWMYGIMKRCHARADRRKSKDTVVYTDTLPETADSGAEQVYMSVDSAILRDAIANMPKDMKDVIILHYFMDASLVQMAKMLAIPVGTVKRRLHFARLALAKRLGVKVKRIATVAAFFVAGLALFSVAATVAVAWRGAKSAEEVPSAEEARTAAIETAGAARIDRIKGADLAGETSGGTDETVGAIVAASPVGPAIPAGQTGREAESKKGEPDMNMTKATAMATTAVSLAISPLTAAAGVNDGYIESEGDAFISLGHCAGPGTRIEVDMEMTEVAQNVRPFGSYGDHSSNPMFSLYISDGGDGILRFSWECTASSGRQARNLNAADQERRTIIFDAPAATYSSVKDGVADIAPYQFSEPVAGMTSTVPLAVFAMGTRKSACKSGDFLNAGKMKVYGVDIYESGSLVKRFVPCLKGGIPGLKDTIGGTFHTGVDVSKVKYGGDILVEKDDAHIDFENDIKEYGYGKNLRIDTGYTVGPNTRIELDYALLAGWSSGSWGVNPQLFSANGLDLWIYGKGDGCYAFTLGGTQYYGSNRGEVANMSAATAYGVRRTAAMNSNSVWFVTAGYTNAMTAVSTAVTANLGNPLRVGCRYDGIIYMPIRIYGLKIFEKDAPARDYVPVVTNGVPRLVDTISGGFITPATLVKSSDNNSKTNVIAVAGGDFDDHTQAAEREAYLEFPGTGAGIDTGYSVGSNSCIEADFSLWSAGGRNQELISQDSGTDGSYVTFISAGSPWTIWFKYADAGGDTKSVVATANVRRRYVADRREGVLTISSGDSVLYTGAMSGTNTRPGGGSNTLKIGRLNAAMRVYGFKIFEYVDGEKTPVRDFVPCVRGGVAGLYDLCGTGFYPLSDGVVCGMGSKGHGEFAVAPKAAKVTRTGNVDPALSCIAPGAKFYEWYADGERVEGESGDSLVVNWRKLREPYKVTYSVVPVYEVFNETVRGTAATAVVTMPPKGTALFFK